jgi:hypothetical protein
MRRDFLKLSLTSFIATFFGCSRSPEINQDMKSAIKEEAFGYFLNAVFPARLLGFQKHQKNLTRRLKNLNRADAKKVIWCYHQFKAKYKDKYGSFESYTFVKGESVILRVIRNRFFFGDSKEANQALDIIYEQIGRLRGLLQEDLWGRKYSTAGKMCVYWDNYDQPVT